MGILQLLSANELVVQILNFLVLFFLLRAFGWKKILAALDARRQKIAGDFAEIEQKKGEMAQVKTDYEEKLKHIDELSRRKMQETAVMAQQLTDDIKKDAYHQAERILDQARMEIRSEVDKAKGQLNTHLVDLVMQATERVIDEKMSMEEDRKIVDNFLTELDKK